ncbi:hypothetical protein DLS62_09185, partial [Staphylococcus pseudintermedius]
VFASDFLQIPLRNGHPCLSLTVPTTKPVTDFHRQDVTHAGRTEKKRGVMVTYPSLFTSCMTNYTLMNGSQFKLAFPNEISL